MKYLAAVFVAAFLALAFALATEPRPPPKLEPMTWCYLDFFGRAFPCRDLPFERDA